MRKLRLRPLRRDKMETDLYVLDDALELRGPLRPGVDQVHGPVKVLHVFTVHLHERSQFLQDVSDSRVGVPAADAETQRCEAEHHYKTKQKDHRDRSSLKPMVDLHLTRASSI